MDLADPYAKEPERHPAFKVRPVGSIILCHVCMLYLDLPSIVLSVLARPQRHLSHTHPQHTTQTADQHP